MFNTERLYKVKHFLRLENGVQKVACTKPVMNQFINMQKISLQIKRAHVIDRLDILIQRPPLDLVQVVFSYVYFGQ